MLTTTRAGTALHCLYTIRNDAQFIVIIFLATPIKFMLVTAQFKCIKKPNLQLWYDVNNTGPTWDEG